MTGNTLGWYDNKTYPHNEHQEKVLFTDSMQDYLKHNDGEIVGVEIGVYKGETSRFLLQLDDRIKLIGIDPIIPDSMNSNMIGNTETIKSNTREFNERFIFINEYSYDAHSKISNNLNFLFIDGSHHDEDVKRDYELYKPKVIHGGLIYFHDSRMNRGGASWHPAPSQLVDNIINDQKLTLIGEAFSLTCFKNDG